MVFAHIPSGYLLANLFVQKRKWPTWLLWLGMLGATFPDFDILLAEFTTHDMIGHRVSPMHFPIVWALVAAILLTIILLTKQKSWLPAWGVFFSAAMLHLVLDTLVGDIYWLAPFSWTPIHIISIPSHHAWWLADHVLHWSFLFEIGIIVAAAIIFFRGGYRDLFDLPKRK